MEVSAWLSHARPLLFLLQEVPKTSQNYGRRLYLLTQTDLLLGNKLFSLPRPGYLLAIFPIYQSALVLPPSLVAGGCSESSDTVGID